MTDKEGTDPQYLAIRAAGEASKADIAAARVEDFDGYLDRLQAEAVRRIAESGDEDAAAPQGE